MRFVALLVRNPHPDDFCSSCNVRRIEFEAIDKDDALRICGERKWTYHSALGDPDWKPTKEIVFRELCPGLVYKRETVDG